MLLYGSIIICNHAQPQQCGYLHQFIPGMTYLYSHEMLRPDVEYSGHLWVEITITNVEERKEHLTWLDATMMHQTHG
jgi:hypothetical protein